jgi:hypothetical protein
MRQQLLRFVLALSLVVSAGSLIGNGVPAQANGFAFCCVCFDCGHENATMAGLDSNSAMCTGVADSADCDSACADLGCIQHTFANATCSDPSLASLCSPGVARAPTASMFGLVALIAVLLGFGAFYLRDRRA